MKFFLKIPTKLKVLRKKINIELKIALKKLYNI